MKPGVDTKEKPFHCFCGASFTRKDLLRRHENLVHVSSPSLIEQSTERLCSTSSVDGPLPVSLDLADTVQGENSSFNDMLLAAKALQRQFLSLY
jgi:uncharacterized Zn-finger protein